MVLKIVLWVATIRRPWGKKGIGRRRSMDYYQFPLLDMRMTGQRIRETCALQGLTVRDVRISLGIGSFQSVYNWFAGKTLPSLDHMVSLSYLLKKSLDELVCSTGVRIWEAPEPDEAQMERLRRYGDLLGGSMGRGRDVKGFSS